MILNQNFRSPIKALLNVEQKLIKINEWELQQLLEFKVYWKSAVFDINLNQQSKSKSNKLKKQKSNVCLHAKVTPYHRCTNGGGLGGVKRV